MGGLHVHKGPAYIFINFFGWGSPVTQTRVSRTLLSRHFLSISTCDIGYFDICFQTFNAQWQLNPDNCFQTIDFKTPVSRHLFPKGIKTPVSLNHIQTPVSRHLFPGTISRHLFPDTCFPKPNPDPCSQDFACSQNSACSRKKNQFPNIFSWLLHCSW